MRAPAELARVLAGQQERRGAPAAVTRRRRAPRRSAAPSSSSPASRPGLFGGPLFTLLKALTAMKLARAGVARARRGRRAGLLDRRARITTGAEVSSCTVLDAELAPQTDPSRGPARRRRASRRAAHPRRPTSTPRIDALEHALPVTEFTPALLDDIRSAYQPGPRDGRGLRPAASSRCSGPHGLVVYDSSDPAAKPLAPTVFARELANPGDHRAAGARRPGRRCSAAAITRR